MEHEIREAIYIAVGAIVLSIVLGIVSFAMLIRGNIAQARNDQTISIQRVREEGKYNKYDGQVLIGDDVIECIRYNYDSGIDIFVDSRTLTTTNSSGNTIAYIIDEARNRTCSLCLTDGSGNKVYDHRHFNYEQYVSHLDAPENTLSDYFSISISNINRPRYDMRNWFPTDAKYLGILVYNSMDTEEYAKNIISKAKANPKWSASNYAAKIKLLVDSQQSFDISSEVSGIIFLSLSKLHIFV